MGMRHIALLIPHTDTTLESDLQSTLGKNVIIHTARMWLDEVGEEAEKAMVSYAMPKAAQTLKGITSFDGAIFGCTSASAVNGIEGVEKIESFLAKELCCPAVSALGAVLQQLQATPYSSLALVTPYTKGVNAFMLDTLRSFQVRAGSAYGMGISLDPQIAKVSPKEILSFIESRKQEIQENAGAVFVSCTNLRAAEIREEIERMLARPVITSNAAILRWISSLLSDDIRDDS